MKHWIIQNRSMLVYIFNNRLGHDYGRHFTFNQTRIQKFQGDIRKVVETTLMLNF